MPKRERNYRKEYDDYHGKPEQIKRRNARNKARAKMKAAGHCVVGKDVDHKNGNPLDNSKKNLRVTSVRYNRSQHKSK